MLHAIPRTRRGTRPPCAGDCGLRKNRAGLFIHMVNTMQDTISLDIESFSKEIVTVKTSGDVLRGVKGLLVGAAFSLRKAHQLGFNAAESSRYDDELDSAAQQIAANKLPEEGDWLAGFYFNSALMRIAAAYHILLKRMLDINDKQDLSRKALKDMAIKNRLICEDDIVSLDEVYQDVNDFKHEGGKLLMSRRIRSINDAITAGQKLISVFKLA